MVNDVLRHQRGPLAISLQIGQHHHEFIAAQPAREVFIAYALAQPPRHFLQHQVAGLVAMDIVDGLEAVEVDEQHRAAAAATLGGRQQMRAMLEDQGAVGQPGQRVMQRGIAHPLLGQLALADVLHRAAQGNDGAAVVAHCFAAHVEPLRRLGREVGYSIGVGVGIWLDLDFDVEGLAAAQGVFQLGLDPVPGACRYQCSLHVGEGPDVMPRQHVDRLGDRQLAAAQLPVPGAEAGQQMGLLEFRPARRKARTALVEQVHGAAQRHGERTAFPDASARHGHRLAGTDGHCRRDQRRDRAGNVAPDQPRQANTDGKQRHHADHCGQDRALERTFQQMARHRDGNAPSGCRRAAVEHQRWHAFQRGQFGHALRLARHRLDQLPGWLAADECLLSHGTGDDGKLGIEYPGDPLRRQALRCQQVEEAVRQDADRQHIGHPAFRHDRHVHADDVLLQQRPHEQPGNRWLAGGENLSQLFRQLPSRQRRVKRSGGIEQLLSAAVPQHGIGAEPGQRHRLARLAMKGRQVVARQRVRG